MSSVYRINKGVNKPVEFKGFKAQYIWYLGAGLVLLLMGFAVLYICGVNPALCLGIILLSGAGLFIYVGRMSRTYGAYGWMKKIARKRVPKVIKSTSRRYFLPISPSQKN
ncbi:MAG: hypothetical protein JWP69_1651 [Flaviaesturariibacter sp.]|nr:hypothetical protein [Flaviaesturariibacter sp.]